nr:hypothetical protein Itr_chr07CG04750 [Ipomoea trifida]
MDRKSSSLEDIGMGDPGIINGEIGQGVVGDEDAVGGQERGEAIVEVEALEMGEREALGDDMVRDEQGVENEASRASGEVGNGIVPGDEESGREGKG